MYNITQLFTESYICSPAQVSIMSKITQKNYTNTIFTNANDTISVMAHENEFADNGKSLWISAFSHDVITNKVTGSIMMTLTVDEAKELIKRLNVAIKVYEKI